jgi:hypothetical protein
MAVDNAMESGKPRGDIPLLEEPPADMKEPPKTRGEAIADKLNGSGRPKKDEPAKPEESTTPPPESPVAGISELLSEEQASYPPNNP